MGSRSLEAKRREVQSFETVARRRSEEAPRASDESYRTLFEAIDQGMSIAEVILDDAGEGVDCRIVEANPKFEELTGITRTQLLGGATIRELIPTLEESWSRIKGRVAVTGEPARFENYAAALDRWIEVYAFRVCDPADHLVAAIYTDITSRRRAEQALQNSEKIQKYLLKLSDALRPIANPVEIMRVGPEVLARELGMSVAGYVEMSDDGNSMVIGGQFNDGRVPELKGACKFSDFGDGFAPSLARGEEIFIPDVYEDPRGPKGGTEKTRAFMIRSVAGIPQIKQGRLKGFFYATHFEPRPWFEWEREIVRQTSERTWAAVERARAEAAQRESEEKYHSLFNLIDQSFAVLEVLYDENGRANNLRYIEANPVYEKMSGLKNPAGKTTQELMPHLEDACIQRYARVVKTGEPVRFEHETEDGSHWLNIFAARLGGEGSNLVSVVFDDITERKMSEAALRASEEKYRSLFNLIGQSFVVAEVLYDEKGRADGLRFLETNPAFEKRTGLTDAVGKTSYEIMPGLDDCCIQAYAGVAASGEPIRLEGPSYDGSRVFDVFASRAGGEGSNLVSILFDDITDRKRAEDALRASEEKYRSLFDSIDQGYMVIEVLYDEGGEPTDFCLLEANRVFEKQTGLKNCVGKRRCELFAPSSEDRWLEMYARVAKTGESARVEDYSEGLRRWYTVFAGRIGGEGSHLVNVVFEDVTARKQHEEALRASEDKQAYKWKLGDATRRLSDPLEIQGLASRVLGEKLNADRIFYGEMDEESGQILIERDYVREGTKSLVGRYPLEVFSWIRALPDKTNPGVINDVLTTPMLPDADRLALASVNVEALIAVPLVKDGRLVATCCATDRKPRQWSADELELVWHTAERTWAAVVRAKAETALRESEERYRTLFDSIDQGYALLEVKYDAVGKAMDLYFLETNHVFEKQTGMTNYAGKTARQLNPHLEDRWVQAYADVVETGEAVRFDTHVQEIDRWFTVAASKVGGPESRLVSVVFDDITQRKRDEEVLRESEERQAYLLKLSDALRPLHDWAEVLGKASRILGEQLRADRTLYAEIDVALGEVVITRDYVRDGAPSLVGRYPIEAFAWIRPAARMSRPTVVDDVKAAPFIPDAMRGTILDASVGAFIAVPLRKDGHLVAALCVCELAPRQWSAAEVQLVQETAERTWTSVARAKAEAALREGEERFRLFLENVLEYALVQTDRDLRITSWNAGAERIFGYSSREALGKPFSMLLSPEDRATGVQCTEIARLEKGERQEDARWLMHKGGKRIWTRWVTEPIRNNDGLVTGLAKVLRDETERLKTETSLRQSEKLAVVGRMASSIAHEINNPLEAVTNLIFLARRGVVSPEVGEFLEQAERELARVNHITKATLHFHRQTAEPVVTDIEEILESVMLLHEGRLRSAQVTTVRRYGQHPSTTCQENEIRQVLANLVSNAIDAMQKNSDQRRLLVRVRTVVDRETGEEGVRVMISDTGSGITESARKHVFEPFFTTKAATGTGLGLWISAETVKKHQGTLRFRSRTAGKYRGTVFSVFLKSGTN